MLLPGQIGASNGPVWFGIDQGIFRKHGIDLKVEAPASVAGASAIALINSGKYDVGYASTITMLKARQDEGSHLVQFYGLLQSNPFCLLVRKSSGVASLDQLKGKTIILASSTDNTMMIAMLAKHGITPETAKIESAATAAQFGAFIQNTADAITTFAYSQQPALMATNKIDTKAFCLNEDGFDVQWAGFATRSEFLSSNQAALKALTAALQETYAAANADPNAAAASMARQFPQLAPEPQVGAIGIRMQIRYLHTPNTRGLPLGEMSAIDWGITKQAAIKYFGIRPDFDIASSWTNATFANRR